MAASTSTQRPPAPPATPTKTAVPQGAVKLAKIYLDDRNVPQRSPHPVPVDQDDRRTPHLLHQCPHLRNVNGGGKERCGERQWLLPGSDTPFCPRHGRKLEEPKDGPGAFARTVTAAREMHGPAALPWLVPAAGILTEAAMTAGDITGAQAALSVPALAGGAYLVTKRTLTSRAVKRGRIEKGQRDGKRYLALRRQARTAAALGAEAGAWLTALSATDTFAAPGVLVAAAGMLRWAFAARTWWAGAEQRRTRGDLTAPAPEPAPLVGAPDPVRLRAVTTWATLIGCPGGPLAGTELVDFTRLPACDVNTASRTMLPNWSAKVAAKVEGSINMRENRPTLRGRIAAAYKCTYADVSFYADESDLSIGWVRIQPDNPLAETRLWTGPDSTNWKTGTSRIGRFDDGMPIEYQWCDEGGACHDLIGGCSGSGKSEAVAQLILTSLHSEGLVLDWVGDPQRGQSFGKLKDEVDWFARDKAEIKLMLLAAVKEMYRRNDVLSSRNVKTWRIGVARELGMPLLVVTLDEVQNYIDDPDILELVTILAGMARKCGIKLRLITQIIAAYNLGGDTYIKEQVKTGQTLVFRAETDVAGRSSVEGDSLIDPTELPKKWGPYTCAAGKKTAGLVFVQGVHGRDVYGRTDFTGEDMGVWLVDPAGDPSVSPGRFSPEAQRESGVLWGDRKARAQRLIEAGRNDADILSGGKALELIEQASVAQASQEPVRTREPGQAPLRDRARDIVLAAATEACDINGVVERAAIVRGVHGKVADGTRDKALTDLVADGDLVRVKNGLYRVPGAAKARQLPLEVPAP